jgi:hypothetical protein
MTSDRIGEILSSPNVSELFCGMSQHDKDELHAVSEYHPGKLYRHFSYALRMIL